MALLRVGLARCLGSASNSVDTSRNAAVPAAVDWLYVLVPLALYSFIIAYFSIHGEKDGSAVNVDQSALFVDTLSSSARYNPTNRTWSSIPNSPSTSRNEGVLVPLLGPNTALVVLAGGAVMNDESTMNPNTDVFNAISNTWSTGAAFTVPRSFLVGVALVDGRLLLAGGVTGAPGTTAMANVDLYDPVRNIWATASPMTTARAMHEAVLLPNGNVLVVGGRNGATYFASCEIYNATSGTWAPTGPLTVPRFRFEAVLMTNNGGAAKVLVAGGQSSGGSYVASADLYDVASGTWSAVSNTMSVKRESFGLGVFGLDGVAAMACGGWDGVIQGQPDDFSLTCDYYSLAANSFTSAASLPVRRSVNKLVQDPNGNLVSFGGYFIQSQGGYGYYTVTEVFACTGQSSGSTCQLCAAGFYGPQCQYDCDWCQNNSTCVGDGTTSGYCACASPNWDGQFCDVCAPNHFGPECTSCDMCANGVCSESNTGNCSCAANWNGTVCDQCATGYFGPLCEPCSLCRVNGGQCIDGLNGTCLCPAQRNGTYCELCSSDYFGQNCESCDLCDNGQCVDGIEGQCVCDNYWSGGYCDVCTDAFGLDCEYLCVDCAINNNATCIQGSPGGYCACAGPMYNGTYCEDCASGLFGPSCAASCATCETDGHGQCFDGISGNCTCANLWSGPLCSVCTGAFGQDCSTSCSVCANSTLCIDGTSGYCGCEGGYVNATGCSNRGVCNVNVGQCTCDLGYQGLYCESIAPCNATLCQNGGLCVIDGTTNFPTCQCGARYSGVFCQTLDADNAANTYATVGVFGGFFVLLLLVLLFRYTGHGDGLLELVNGVVLFGLAALNLALNLSLLVAIQPFGGITFGGLLVLVGGPYVLLLLLAFAAVVNLKAAYNGQHSGFWNGYLVGTLVTGDAFSAMELLVVLIQRETHSADVAGAKVFAGAFGSHRGPSAVMLLWLICVFLANVLQIVLKAAILGSGNAALHANNTDVLVWASAIVTGLVLLLSMASFVNFHVPIALRNTYKSYGTRGQDEPLLTTFTTNPTSAGGSEATPEAIPIDK